MNQSITRIKKSCSAAAILLVSLCSFSGGATEFVITGAIYILSTTDKQIWGEAEGGSSLRFTSASVPMPQTRGTCFTGSSGHLVINVRENTTGERMYTTLLAAQLSGHNVTVTIDDAFYNSKGHCYAQRVRIEL